jgi:hypothetical protein
VISWVQAFAFKCDVYRYTQGAFNQVEEASAAAAAAGAHGRVVCSFE